MSSAGFPEKGRGVSSSRHASLADSIYSTLRQEILSLAIPPGAQLDEAALVRRFGISRTPVREAIRRLVADQLVDLALHQSATVRPILFEGVRDYFECLRVVQKAVFVLSAARISLSQIERAEAVEADLEAAIRRRDIVVIPKLNSDLHMAIAAGAGNQFLEEAYDRLMVQGSRLATLTLHSYLVSLVSEWDVEAAKLAIDHNDILAAARRHDQRLMAELSDRHAELFRTRVVHALASEKSEGLVGDVGSIAAQHLLPDN